MRFLNPAGLWLLLGIPILILIHLIRAHHEDRSVSSTFIWKLSSRFMKNRLPMQRLQRVLLFILQLVIFLCIALMVSRPALVTGKSCEYIAVIDASASMNTRDEEGVSRFRRAAEEAFALSEHIQQGHRVSVILASDSPQYLIQSSASSSKLRLALENAQYSLGGCDAAAAMTLAQQLCDQGAAEVYFYTDSPYPKSDNITVVNVNQKEWNVGVGSLFVENSEEGGRLVIGSVTSYNRDAEITVGLRVDENLRSAQKVLCLADEPTEVVFSLGDDSGGQFLEIFVDENDGLAEDNSYILCTGSRQSYNVLLASPSPLYLHSAFSSFKTCSVVPVSSLEGITLTGYDLYIFDGIYPESYPTDGSILQFGTQVLPDGLSAGAEAQAAGKLSLSAGVEEILSTGLRLYDTALSQSSSLTGSGQWGSVLSCGSGSVCMTRQFGVGQRFTVFGFDLHNSNLPLQTDFVVLMRNLLNASVFDLIEASDYVVGRSVPFSVLPSAQQVYVELPDGSIKNLNVENGKSTMIPETPGLHTAVVTTASGGEYADFFVHIPTDEALCEKGPSIGISLTESDSNAPDAIAELWFWLAAAALILLILEWGVYHYEQY